jgi:hypothetical protein
MAARKESKMTKMAVIEQFELRKLVSNERPIFTHEWTITDDRKLILIPKTELGRIYIISVEDYHKKNEIRTKDNYSLPIRPICLSYIKVQKDQGHLFTADEKGSVWMARINNNLLKTRELRFDLVSNSADWTNDIRKNSNGAELNIWKIAPVEFKDQKLAFILGYSGLSDVRGCLRIINASNGTYITSLYPIDEAPADIAFTKPDTFFYVLIATGRGGKIERYLCQFKNDHNLSISLEKPIEHPELVMPSKIKKDPNSNGFWVSSFNKIFHIASGGKEIQVIKVSEAGDAIADFDFSIDGKNMFATCLFSNQIVSLDTKKGSSWK